MLFKTIEGEAIVKFRYDEKPVTIKNAVKDKDGEVVESVCGYDDEEYALTEAKAIVDNITQTEGVTA